MYITGDPKLPIHLLIFAVQTAVTTSTCIADYLSWTRFSNAEKLELGKLYVPYLALCKCLSRSICGFWSLVASHRLLGLGNIMQGLTPTQETAWHEFLMRSVHQPSKATRARWAIHTTRYECSSSYAQRLCLATGHNPPSFWWSALHGV